MNLVRFIFLLASCSVAGLVYCYLDLSPLMDSKERQEFLASVEAEEDWLESVSRRLSLPSSTTPLLTPTPSSQPATPSLPAKAKVPSSAGPATRSSRKRRITQNNADPHKMSDSGQAPGKRSSREDRAMLDRIEAMISDVRSDIASLNQTPWLKLTPR